MAPNRRPRSPRCGALSPWVLGAVLLIAGPLVAQDATDAAPVPAHRWTRGLPPPEIPGFQLARVNPQGCPEYDLVLSWDPVPRVPAVTMRFVLIPAGTYAVGGDDVAGRHGPDPRASVTVEAFLLARTECTRAQWAAVMGEAPRTTARVEDDSPVTHVSWQDIQWFERRTRLTLPSSTRWEVGARGGADGGWLDGLVHREWHKANAGFGPHPVGRLRPNGFGLYDMLGNVREWCEDSDMPASVEACPPGGEAGRSPGATIMRQLRGGGWVNSRDGCDPRRRDSFVGGHRGGNVGFRPMRPLRPGALVSDAPSTSVDATPGDAATGEASAADGAASATPSGDPSQDGPDGDGPPR